MGEIVAKRLRGFTHEVVIDGHELIVDEPPAKGGDDNGPAPSRLLAASLASCIAITVEMYADRKGWELPELEVGVEIGGDPTREAASYAVTLRLPDGLSEDQVERIERIAGKCPVHRAIAEGRTITLSSRVGASGGP
jgi:putative redox protein